MGLRSRVKRPRSALRTVIAALAIGSSAGCAAGTPAATAAQSPTAASAPAGTTTPAQSPGTAPGAPATAVKAAVPAQRLPEIVLDPKQPMRPLPELKVENIGLHIGGGPNDAETKAPFLNAVAERFPSFMDCYRKNEDPAQGGRFGVDLHVARAGGHPRIEQPRTSLRGPEFRACLGAVFESVEFQKPKRGPTTLSYSLRFMLVEAP
ncbi:MAG TPA: hypothetical protein VJV79_15325 [Polyangiaceae bacterium]|nr:hypothetical protein [Polyangiaceae bacterium]